MRAVVQRVSRARVAVDGGTVGEIDRGVLILVGIAPEDGAAEVAWLAEKVSQLRIFPDDDGKMNRSLLDIGGGLLAVPQFTLVADTRKGSRPSFSSGATPEEGARLFHKFVEFAAQKIRVQSGRFGAEMRVNLVNDGPVTFWQQIRPGS